MQASSLKLSCTFRWGLGPDWVLAIKMCGKTEILSVQSQKLNRLSSSNFQLSLFLMSTKSYLKFRTIRSTPQKWVGFGKPLYTYLERWVVCMKTASDYHNGYHRKMYCTYTKSGCRLSHDSPSKAKTWLLRVSLGNLVGSCYTSVWRR